MSSFDNLTPEDERELEYAMKEAMQILLEEIAAINIATEAIRVLPILRHADREFEHEQKCKLERDRNVWLLKGKLMSLVKLSKARGFRPRTLEAWYSLLFFATFASAPTSGCQLECCPTYPAHRLRKMAEYYLENPSLIPELCYAFQQHQFAHQQTQRS